MHVIQLKRTRWHGVFRTSERREYSSPNFEFYATPREPLQTRQEKLEAELSLVLERIHVGPKIIQVFEPYSWTRASGRSPLSFHTGGHVRDPNFLVQRTVQPRSIRSNLIEPDQVSNKCIHGSSALVSLESILNC